MAALVVTLVALVGTTVVLPLVSGGGGPVVDLRVSVTPSTVTVNHDGGTALAPGSVTILVRGPDGETRVPMETEFPAARFETGTTVAVGGQSFNPGDKVRVLVRHDRTGELLFDGRKFARLPPGPTSRRLVWSTESDWDAGSGTRVVHDGVGSRLPSRLQLGYGLSTDAPGLVSYYPLDDTEGVVVTDATGLNDGTLVDDSEASYDDAYDRGVGGVFGSRATRYDPQVFEPDDDPTFTKGAYVDLGSRTADRIADGSFTFTAWIRTNGPESGGRETIVGVNDDDRSNEFIFRLCKPEGDLLSDPDCPVVEGRSDPDLTDDAHLTMYYAATDTNIVADETALNDGNWHHVAVVYDAGADEVRLFVDGSREGSGYVGDGLEASDVMYIGQEDDNQNLGGFGSGTSDFFDGTIDEVRVFDRALPAADILQEAGRSGTYTTDVKRFPTDIDGADLQLSGVDADPNGGTVTVYVEADSDGDGDFERTSDPVALDAATSTYSVSFPGTFDAEAYRLRVELDASGRTNGPTVDRIDLERT